MNILPKSNDKNIVVQAAGCDLLIYDLTTHQAYSLNDTSRIVFEACDGRSTFDELKQSHGFTDDLIYFTLEKLQHQNLIESAAFNHFDGLSRREVIRRIGLASMIALPAISSITAPQSALALSVPACLPEGASCVFNTPPGCCPVDCPAGGSVGAACFGGTCSRSTACPF